MKRSIRLLQQNGQSICIEPKDMMKNGLLDESKGIQDHKELTDIWQQGGIVEGQEYAILTNEIYKEWSGMTAKRIQRVQRSSQRVFAG